MVMSRDLAVVCQVAMRIAVIYSGRILLRPPH